MLYQHVRRPFWRRHPAVSVIVLAMTSWWLWHGWYQALALTAVVGLLVGFSRHRRAAASTYRHRSPVGAGEASFGVDMGVSSRRNEWTHLAHLGGEGGVSAGPRRGAVGIVAHGSNGPG